MHYAAKYGQVSVLQYLNLKEVSITAKNQMGWSPFHQVPFLSTYPYLEFTYLVVVVLVAGCVE